jgi:ankyrin repeat protein
VAQLEWRNHEGKTALHLAIENSHVEIAKYILDNFEGLDI